MIPNSFKCFLQIVNPYGPSRISKRMTLRNLQERTGKYVIIAIIPFEFFTWEAQFKIRELLIIQANHQKYWLDTSIRHDNKR